ncbi:EcoAI/FtnUII family type I restriction enzme subunit R [Helicobacter anatolicus]|uniref:EcoAI/FtnUII family type I restriction enzme subunit R n=1 Tax=Helicobacter anatolicus TaxID=2905874 RepID=UPI001E58F18A|nr:type I restriction endonuclease subunit R [Helicobacter anatolicus]MCE3038214.1 DEAD/DEAH box helicase family protein [Helicobacter anatolicus]
MYISEADTRIKFIDTKLKDSHWSEDCIKREYYFTDGRKLLGNKRGVRKFADYLLSFQNNNLAIIEAKKLGKDSLSGLSQAIEYAKILNIRFVYVTNGEQIYEYDMCNLEGGYIEEFPSPQILFARTFGNLLEWQYKLVTQREYQIPQKELRYYQKIAVDRVVQALINNKNRILLTLATGTGKTTIAFALCYRLLESKWNLENANRKPKILFLCDRITLRNQALSEFNYIESDCKEISAEELKKNEGRVPTSGDVFFGIYQSLSSVDKSKDREEKDIQEGIESKFYLQYPKDFFDLIIIDECHRGGANETGSWRAVLEYFKSAVHLGLTATPKRSDNIDTYKYFGDAVYEYSLKEGIEDGFLTPYKVKRIITSLNDGYTHNLDDIVQGKLEKEYYEPGEFERTITLPKYNEFIAKKILKLINPMDKTIIFCANQAHASAMKVAIDKFKEVNKKEYCMRVTSDEGVDGLNSLKAFQDNDKEYPVILTSSKMLTTGVDARNVRNIVLLANIGSIIEFKQIIGRGTRIYENKDFFTILDFFGATKLFYDPKWDGESNVVSGDDKEDSRIIREDNKSSDKDDDTPPKQKVIIHLKGTKLKVLDIETRYIGGDGRPLGTKEFLEFLIGKLGSFYNNEKKLKEMWSNAENRDAFLKSLANEGIDSEVLENLKEIFERKDCDIYDILAHISFNSEILSRSERVLSVKNSGFLSKFHKERTIRLIEFLLGYYEEHGINDFNNLGRLLELSSLGKAYEIVEDFGGIPMLRESIEELQREIYGV